jgi:hypothetical protein
MLTCCQYRINKRKCDHEAAGTVCHLRDPLQADGFATQRQRLPIQDAQALLTAGLFVSRRQNALRRTLLTPWGDAGRASISANPARKMDCISPCKLYTPPPSTRRGQGSDFGLIRAISAIRGQICPRMPCGIARHGVAMGGAAWHARGRARYPLRVFFLCHLFRFGGQRDYNPGTDKPPGDGHVITGSRRQQWRDYPL